MNIFIDGSYGTAGILLIEQLTALQSFYNFKIITLDLNEYKDQLARYAAIEKADIAILCLPEDIALQTMHDLSHIKTKIIDVSPAHRLATGWVYGFHELYEDHNLKIQTANRIANPGCFATGMISLLNPIKNHLNAYYPLVINGVTGYSAGGKKAIEKQLFNPIGFRATNLNKIHRHIPEVMHITELKNKIMFNPTVGNYDRGQMVQITIFQEYLNNLSLKDIKNIFINYYKDSEVIKIKENNPSFLSPEIMKDSNNLDIYIIEPDNSEYVQLVAIYDNLGKGATGSVIQTLKLLLQNYKK